MVEVYTKKVKFLVSLQIFKFCPGAKPVAAGGIPAQRRFIWRFA
jgi:hypothetical protein